MKKTIFFISIIFMLNHCERKNPFFEVWNTPYGIPPFEKIEAEDYLPALKEGIKIKEENIQKIIENKAKPSFKNVIEEYEFSGELLDKVIGILFNISDSDCTPAISDILEEAYSLTTSFEDRIFMNKAFFEKIKAVKEGGENLTQEQRMVCEKLYTKFIRNGVALNDNDKDKIVELNKKLSLATQKFGKNLLAENNNFQAKFGIPISTYTAEMSTNKDREKRKQMFEAYSNRGNNNDSLDTKALCLEILKLRAEKSEILGYNNFAEYQLSDKMAKEPKIVDEFLSKIIKASVAKAKEEIKDMQKIMDEDIKAGLLPKGSKIEAWDYFYYAERVREAKYNIDNEEVRAYFVCDSVQQGVFKAAKRLYGVNVEKLDDVKAYHPDANVFKLTEDDGSLIGIFISDYYPRSTKRGGAWMNNFRNQYVKDGIDTRPIIVNVCSFTPPTDSMPSLLTADEVETLFHEFGHALHGFLSKCHYPTVSGTSVSRDFVEMFSQFNENWAFQPEILATYAKHYKTGELIPEDLVKKIISASKFNQGFMTTELCAASILDMKWHELSREDLEGVSIADFEKKVCEDMGLIEQIIPRYRTSYFNHIFNNEYCAGYYGYLWSEVLDKGAFEVFENKGIYNPEVAKSFKETFLEQGGSVEPMTLYLSFTGKQPNPDALLRARGLKD